MHTVRNYRWNHTDSTELKCIYNAIQPKLKPKNLVFILKKNNKIQMLADGNKIACLMQFRLNPIDTNTFRAIAKYRPKSMALCIEVNKMNLKGKFTCKNIPDAMIKLLHIKDK